MGLPTGEIEVAAIDRYRNDSGLQTLLGGPYVFDETGVPTNTPFPYLVVCQPSSTRGTAKAFGSDSVDTRLRVICYTQSGGFKQARAILKYVYDITQEKPFALANGFHNFFLQFDNEIAAPAQVAPLGGFPTQTVANDYRCKVQG
jgi:hypothetical protein